MYVPSKKEIKAFYKPRIGNFQGGLITGFAAAIWGLQFVLSLTGFGEIISEILGILADIILFVWLLFLGVYGGTDQGKKWLVTIAGSIVEIIPFINDIPAGIAEVVTLIAFTRAEDWKKAKGKAIAAYEAQEAARLQREIYIRTMNQRRARGEIDRTDFDEGPNGS